MYMENRAASCFPDRYGIGEHDSERYLAAALSRGGDYADLFFEHVFLLDD